MDELKLDRTFVQVVQSGSISAAARHLDTSVTSVARQLSRLESNLGIRLLNRTTRKQSLTDAGELYYSELLDILRQVDDLKREVASYQSVVKGRLKVHLRTSIGDRVIVPALPGFLDEHPDVTLEITLTDVREDLVALGIDVAVWLGDLQDSSLIARRLSSSRRVLCASPNYLNKHGRPKDPRDLKDHNCIVYLSQNYDNTWRFTKDGEVIKVSVEGNVQTSSSAVLLTSALIGMGLIIVQEPMVHHAILQGHLVPVLADYEVSPTEFDVGLYAVYPSSRRISPKTRAFVDFLVALFRQQNI